jgi:hypothetical protein
MEVPFAPMRESVGPDRLLAAPQTLVRLLKVNRSINAHCEPLWV